MPEFVHAHRKAEFEPALEALPTGRKSPHLSLMSCVNPSKGCLLQECTEGTDSVGSYKLLEGKLPESLRFVCRSQLGLYPVRTAGL